MPFYGYRLFEATIRLGNKQQPHEVSDCDGRHFSEVAEQALERLRGRTLVGNPQSSQNEVEESPPVDDDHQGKPAFRVESVERHGRLIQAIVLAGRYGDFTTGLSAAAGGEDVSLEGVAPARRFRVALNFPEQGAIGLLAVEDVSRSCPVQAVQRWLKWASQQEGIEALQAKRDADLEKIKDKGGTTPGSPKPSEDLANSTWWKLALKPLADEEHLRRLVQQGKLERVELIRRGQAAGRTPGTRELELSAVSLDDAQRTQVADMVLDWGRRAGRYFGMIEDDGTSSPASEDDGPLTDNDAARALAALLGEDIAALDFDDGYVVIKDSAGKGKNLSPSRLSDYFIYSLSRERRPPDVDFWSAARDTALRIAVATKTATLEWPGVD